MNPHRQLHLSLLSLTVLFVADSEGRKMLRMHFDRNFGLFYVEVPGGTILSHGIEENEKFPAQFGREVCFPFQESVMIVEIFYFPER